MSVTDCTVEREEERRGEEEEAGGRERVMSRVYGRRGGSVLVVPQQRQDVVGSRVGESGRGCGREGTGSLGCSSRVWGIHDGWRGSVLCKAGKGSRGEEKDKLKDKLKDKRRLGRKQRGEKKKRKQKQKTHGLFGRHQIETPAIYIHKLY